MASRDFVIITIDGPAGSGKSTLARGLARELGLTYLSTGATYRALALKALREGIDPEDETRSAQLAANVQIDFHPAKPEEDTDRVILDGEDVTDQLSKNAVSKAASKISKHPEVRKALVRLQRGIAKRALEDHHLAGVVLEGRDTGTVVFPDADVKLYLDARLEERALRRLEDFDPGETNLKRAKAEILTRDISDMRRKVSPLKPAPDAIRIDNTNWEIGETLAHALGVVRDALEG